MAFHNCDHQYENSVGICCKLTYVDSTGSPASYYSWTQSLYLSLEYTFGPPDTYVSDPGRGDHVVKEISIQNNTVTTPAKLLMVPAMTAGKINSAKLVGCSGDPKDAGISFVDKGSGHFHILIYPPSTTGASAEWILGFDAPALPLTVRVRKIA